MEAAGALGTCCELLAVAIGTWELDKIRTELPYDLGYVPLCSPKTNRKALCPCSELMVYSLRVVDGRVMVCQIGIIDLSGGI